MNARDRRALRLGGGTVLAAALLFRVLPGAWRQWRAFQEVRAARAELLWRARDQVAGVATLDSIGGEVRRRFVGLAPKLVPGSEATEAGAGLSALVGSIADGARMRVRQTEVETDSAAAGRLRRTGIVVSLEGDWSGVRRFFAGVAKERVALTIAGLTVQATDPLSDPRSPELLTVQAVVRGWYLPGDAR